MSPSGRRYDQLLEKQHLEALSPHRGQGPGHGHGMYPHEEDHSASVDVGCDLVSERPQERFVYVGENRGHYEESRRGNFHYVGAGQGHYEKERVPPKRTWQRVLVTGCFVLALAAVGVVVVQKFLIPEEPAFDCMVGLQNAEAGWSELKREYCCENEGYGCRASLPGEESGGPATREEPMPLWLDWWLADAALGMKFTISAVLALTLGCCCGCCFYYRWLVTHAPKRRSPTEAELADEIKKLLKRVGAKTGELAVSLMWDTTDDLDLHLKLPDAKGEISAEHPEAYGGKLDVDGNHTLEMASTKPIENISWPEYSPSQRNSPPVGNYGVYVKVFARHQHARDINLTVAVTISGRLELFHLRICTGVSEVLVCNFKYDGPEPSPRHSHSHSGGHGSHRTRQTSSGSDFHRQASHGSELLRR